MELARFGVVAFVSALLLAGCGEEKQEEQAAAPAEEQPAQEQAAQPAEPAQEQTASTEAPAAEPATGEQQAATSEPAAAAGPPAIVSERAGMGGVRAHLSLPAREWPSMRIHVISLAPMSEKQRQRLERLGELRYFDAVLGDPALGEQCRGAEILVISPRLHLDIVPFLDDCRFISVQGTGTDALDVSAAVLESRLGGGSRRFRYLPGNVHVARDQPARTVVVRRDDYLAALEEGVDSDHLVAWLAERGRETVYTPDASVSSAPPPVFGPHVRATLRHARARGEAARRTRGGSVGGSTVLGTVNIQQDASDRLVDAVAGMATSQRWIYASTLNPPSVLYMSATTPIPGGTCGRVVLSDLHVSAGAA